VIARLTNLKLLLTTGLRNNSLDLIEFKARGIPVAGAADTPTGASVGSRSTTEHCVALILAAARNIAQDDLAVKSGFWQTSVNQGLHAKVLGVVGLGRLGLAVAKIMNQAFGMKIVCWSQNLTQEAADGKAKASGLPIEGPDGEKTFKFVSRETLFESSDVISLHLVLSDRTRGLIGTDDLSRMKKSAFFVNTSRGPLVKEADLLDILKKGVIRGAALDVFDLEPLPMDSEWRTTTWGEAGRSQVLLTPHMGYVEEHTLKAWYEQQVENIKRWSSGEALTNSFF
jgi:lactate dehydrogenase-like 2-hydroxyacid dehydrogenase